MSAAKHENLAAALAAFQESLPVVLKGSTASIPGRSQYKYADLADLSAAVLPALGRQGLSWLAMPTFTDAGNFVLRYELLHTSGENRTGEYALPQGKPQEIGSALTYARRQCLSAVTGVAADEDDDGATALNAAPAQRRASQQRPNGQQRPAEPAPATTPPVAKEALEELAATCEAMGYDRGKVAALFAHQHGGADVRQATDAGVVRKFIERLDDADPTKLKAAPNGVPA